MTPTLKMYSNFVLPSWTMFSHIKKSVVQWPAVCAADHYIVTIHEEQKQSLCI